MRITNLLMDSIQAQSFSFYKPEAQWLLPDSRNIIGLTQKEVKAKREKTLKCALQSAQSVQSIPVCLGILPGGAAP